MISVRTAVALILGTIAALLLGLGYVATWQVRTAGLQADAETRRHESFSLAEAMRQSSDQLTLMVRLYVTTGDPRYRDYFDEILAIRNGTAPRPLHYDGSFWDRVLAHGKDGEEYGPPKSLVQMMRDKHFSDEEFDALNASREASDQLAQVETEVMAHVQTRLAAGRDETYIRDVYADVLRLMDADYLGYKDRIMSAIERFEQMVDARNSVELQALRDRSQRLLKSQLAFLGILLIMSLLFFLLSERGLTRPLRDLMEVTRRIAAGDYGQRVATHSVHELQQLGGTFNDMAAAIQRDIARREQAESQAQEAKRLAEAANQAKGDFLANMSHEIRTPLNAVIGMAEMMGDTPLDDDQKDCLSTISNSGNHLLGIINDILDFSKIEAGMLDLDSQVFDLRRCVEDALELVAVKASEKRLDLATDFKPGTPEGLRGDPQRLRQILVNLLSNAVKFTAEGEVVVSIGAHRLESGLHEFRFEVRDTGIGIPADRMDRLFKTFSQVDSSTTRHYGGTGLGLVICKRLAEMMGGAIGVNSEAGKGSVFFFSIVAETDPQWTAYPQASSVAFQGKQVLIVDDNDTNRRLLRTAAELWGMTARDTPFPREALKWIERGDPFDIAVIDYLMPDMDGRELGAAIRRRRTARQLPMIMASSAQMTRRLAPEFAAVVSKPLRRSTLHEAFEDAFRSAQHGVAASAAPVVSEPGADPPSASVSPAPISALRVLLVEDNEANQKVILRMLQSLGYRADLAHDGAQAVAAVQAKAYDLVLMDVHMPVMNGLEATRRIRQMPVERQPRIFAMTASTLDSERQECVDAGMELHIAKPVRRSVLAAALADVSPEHPVVSGAGDPVGTDAFGDLAGFLDAQVEELSREGVAELLDSLINGAEKALASLLASAADRDGIALRRITHTMKSNCSMMGALALSDHCEALERRARGGDLDGIELSVRTLSEDYANLVRALRLQRPRFG